METILPFKHYIKQVEHWSQTLNVYHSVWYILEGILCTFAKTSYACICIQSLSLKVLHSNGQAANV